MKIIDLMKFQTELNKLDDARRFLQIDRDLPNLVEMTVLNAIAYIKQQEPGYLSDAISRCDSKCTEDDTHEVEQLRKKIIDIMRNSSSAISFEEVF